MDAFLIRSALDARFVDLVCLMCLGVWPWLLIITWGIALFAWKIVIVCQLAALPFAVIGWAMGFRLAFNRGAQPRRAAMVAGWSGLFLSGIGLTLIMLPLFGTGTIAMVLLAFPALAVLVTLGVLWFYRASTWRDYMTKVEGIGG